MARYHINGKGEPGACRAQHACPFGGDANHYDSMEKAQQAFELSMASQTVAPKTRKQRAYAEAGDLVEISHDASLHDNSFKRYQGTRGTVVEAGPASYLVAFPDGNEVKFDHKLVSEPIPQMNGGGTGNSFNPAEWGDFEEHDLTWDDEAEIERIQNVLKPLRDESYGEYTVRVNAALASHRQQWETRARTEPASAYEENVPMRLIPQASEVYDSDLKDKGRLRPYTTVGAPVLGGAKSANDPTPEYVGRYLDSRGNWEYVSGNTLFTTGDVRPAGTLSKHWQAANQEAQKLRAYREIYSAKNRSEA